MKIYFNLIPPENEISYGGGLFFVKNLSNYLKKQGIFIANELSKDLDLIFIIDPRKGPYKKYSHTQLLEYCENTKIKLIYIVNECDKKRQNSIGIEPIILDTISKCDHVVFISNWLKEYYINNYDIKTPYTIINNAADTSVFIPNLNKKLDKKLIRIVSHHWSNDYMKGFEIYNKLDKILPKYPWLKFTFIGNYNNLFKPKNINLKKPISGSKLADELKKHDIYLTASLYEPGGIHQLEGMAAGLPIIYRINSGGIKETCTESGVEFNNMDDLISKIEYTIDNYNQLIEKIDYNFIGYDRCGKQYFNLINNL